MALYSVSYTYGSQKVPGIPLIKKVRQLIQYDRRMTIVEL